MVIWITGYAGAGKSLIARETAAKLKGTGRPVALLDGDEIRKAIGDDSVGHDLESRLTNAMRICRLAALFESQDLWVVVATMSLFSRVHRWNRAHFRAYFEVLVEVPFATLKERDQKGLYSGVEIGTTKNVIGVDLPGELPRAPDLILDNGRADAQPGELAAQIVAAVQ